MINQKGNVMKGMPASLKAINNDESLMRKSLPRILEGDNRTKFVQHVKR